MPAAVIERWVDELKLHPPTRREAELRKRVEVYLDTGHGACSLRDPRIGTLVEDALLFFDGERYQLHAWVVMPNHVHAVFTPAGRSLSDILGSWKSFTAKEANKLLGRTGQFWQEDYFDRFVRNEEHFHRVVEYVELNPVKAGLCESAGDWPFGSARRRCAGEAAGPAALPGKDTNLGSPGSAAGPAAREAAAGPAAREEAAGTAALPGKDTNLGSPGSAAGPAAREAAAGPAAREEAAGPAALPGKDTNLGSPGSAAGPAAREAAAGPAAREEAAGPAALPGKDTNLGSPGSAAGPAAREAAAGPAAREEAAGPAALPGKDT